MIRTYIFEPFRIPSGSMVPTLLIGDHVVVNKASYGLWIPVVGVEVPFMEMAWVVPLLGIGWGVVLDRETGEFLHAFRTAYDNTITGWTREGRPIYDPKSIPTAADMESGKVFEICPHIHGARNLQAPSYSPVTGLYYLGVNNSCMDSTLTPATFRPGRFYSGVTYKAKLAPGYDYVGEFVAFDPVTGNRRWFRPESVRWRFSFLLQSSLSQPVSPGQGTALRRGIRRGLRADPDGSRAQPPPNSAQREQRVSEP